MRSWILKSIRAIGKLITSVELQMPMEFEPGQGLYTEFPPRSISPHRVNSLRNTLQILNFFKGIAANRSCYAELGSSFASSFLTRNSGTITESAMPSKELTPSQIAISEPPA